MNFDKNHGYFYGVLLGDGHINYTKKSIENALNPSNRRGPMLILKCCDLDMIEAWRDSIAKITGKIYAISKHNPGQGTGARRMQYKMRVAQKEFVDNAEFYTEHKTKIPLPILNGDRETKISFIQGLMDAEGWINFYLGNGTNMCDLTLGFGCCDKWFFDFYDLIKSFGIGTSKVYTRKPIIKKNGDNGEKLHLFKINIHDYINAGLSFTIKRKRERLEFCSRILNDYTRDYPRYEDYYRAEDIVWPAMKVAD